MPKPLPKHVLEHVRAVVAQSTEGFHTAPWLLSPFESSDWTLVIGKSRIELDWAIRLGSTYLTDRRHRNLLRAFKCWILVQSHPKVTRGRPHKAAYTYRQVTRVIALIDYMLLNKVSWALESHGLRAVT